jgi:hypothetical protein
MVALFDNEEVRYIHKTQKFYPAWVVSQSVLPCWWKLYICMNLPDIHVCSLHYSGGFRFNARGRCANHVPGYETNHRFLDASVNGRGSSGTCDTFFIPW